MLIAADRVRETTTTTGTGTLTLAGAATGFRSFDDVMANGDECYYAISGGAEWEVGRGTHNTGTLSRDLVLASSNAGALVTFSAGTKDVVMTVPADQLADQMDPCAPRFEVDDFVEGSETGEIGAKNWTITTGTISKLDGQADHPGIVRHASTTTANQVCSFHNTAAVGDQVCRFDEIDHMWLIVREAAAGQTDLTMQAGMFELMGNHAPAHGCYIEIKPADSNYFLVTRNGGSENRVDTGIARGTTWLKLRIRRISATSVGYKLNNGAEVVVTSNIPVAADTLIFGKQHSQTGTTARNVDIDFWSYKLKPLNR